MSFEPIAIVGLALGLPSTRNAEELFDLSPRFAAMPESWARACGFEGQLRGATVGGVNLDAKRFRVPPKQAAQMHRMERLLLRTLADALDDARFNDAQGYERCAFFLGATGLGLD